jgi:hypothetical protein
VPEHKGDQINIEGIHDIREGDAVAPISINSSAPKAFFVMAPRLFLTKDKSSGSSAFLFDSESKMRCLVEMR